MEDIIYNSEKILHLLKSKKVKLTITELVKLTKLTRDKIRIALAYLMGGKDIICKQNGMSKLYSLK